MTVDPIALLKSLNDLAESYQKYYGLPHNPDHPLVPALLDIVHQFLLPLEQRILELERSERNVKWLVDIAQLNCLLVGGTEDKIQQLIEYTQSLEKKLEEEDSGL